MNRLMIFIDGNWVFLNRFRLQEKLPSGNGEERPSGGAEPYQIDYEKVQRVLTNKIRDLLGGGSVPVQLVRSYYFGSYDPDTKVSDGFFKILKSLFFELELFEVKRNPDSATGLPAGTAGMPVGAYSSPVQEKCVDVALAVRMVALAKDDAYDIAVAVIGDRDFVPALQEVRRCGKRVAIVGVRGSCAGEYTDFFNTAGVKDFPVIWLDDLASEIQFMGHFLECQSTLHPADVSRLVRTTYYPKNGELFYCDDCRKTFQQSLQHDFGGESCLSQSGCEECTDALEGPRVGQTLGGVIRMVKVEEKYGFIHDGMGRQYYFRNTDLMGGLVFGEDLFNRRVTFEVAKVPAAEGKRGAAQSVRPSEPSSIGAEG